MDNRTTPELFSLKDKVVILTGGAGLYGRGFDREGGRFFGLFRAFRLRVVAARRGRQAQRDEGYREQEAG